MHIFTFASAVLLCIHPTPISAWTCGSCIADYEVGGIASRWLNAFATGGLPGLDKAVTQDVLILSLEVSSQHQSLRRLKALRSNSINQIHIYDEGAQNGSTIPYIQNYHQLVESISASAYGGGGVTNVTYDVVFTFHTCDRIALRWQENAYTTANVGYGSTLPAGKLIQFKGTDLLTIDLASKKVMNATTSADLLNYYRALDYDLGVWSEKA